MTEPDEVKEMLGRFEREMNVSDAKDNNTVIKLFRYWINREPSTKQKILLEKYAEQKGIGVAVVERPQFSRTYETFEQWKAKSKTKTAYKTRIENYMIKHPKATLSEARGHKRRK